MAKRAPQEEEVGESDDGMGWPAKKGAPAEKPKKVDTGKVKRPSAENNKADTGKAKRPKESAKGDTGKNAAVKSSAVKESAKEPKDNLKASGKRKTSGVRKAAEAAEGEENLSASARRRREKVPAKRNWVLIIGVTVAMVSFLVFSIFMQKAHHEKTNPPPHPAATEAKPAATEAPKKE